MTTKTKLSDRVRPDIEAAPWVVDEIHKLERLAIASKAWFDILVDETGIDAEGTVIRFAYEGKELGAPSLADHIRALAAIKQPVELPGGAVPVVNPQGTGETGNDRPAAPISSTPNEPPVVQGKPGELWDLLDNVASALRDALAVPEHTDERLRADDRYFVARVEILKYVDRLKASLTKS